MITLTPDEYFQIKNLFLACSTDASRPALQKVFIDVKAGRFVATDGHIMALLPIGEIQVGDGEHLYFERRDFLLTKKQVKDMGKDEIEVQIHEGDPYPDYNKVIPEKAGSVTEIGLDVNILAKFGEIFPERRGWFRLVPWGKLGAIRVYGTGSDPYLYGVIMPVKLLDMDAVNDG